MTSSFDRKMLDLLVCPFTKQALKFDKDAGELISLAAGLAFPIKDGIPMLCADAARTLSEAEQTAHKLKSVQRDGH